jgi:stage II sporulation protein D
VFTPFHLLFLFAFVVASASGREVTVRLYSNQSPSQVTLIRGGSSSVVKAGDAVLRVSGPWQIRVPGQDALVLSYPLEIRTQGGRLALTITVPLEPYVAGVLAGESAGFRAEQALAAMAVAARTYAVRFEGRHKSEGYDFCDTTHCQDLRIGGVSERLRQAAGATEGELLWFEGAPAATFYGKDCGGVTESAALVWPDLMKAPYLKSHDDPYCRFQAVWSSTIRKQDLRSALAASGIRVPPRLDSLRIAGRSPSGRASRLQVGGQVISASSLRFAVGRELGWNQVRSDLYDLTDSGDRVLFEGRGYGHGVGLCQAGAARMGEDGRSYRQILEFYYPGTKLGVSAQGFSWQSLGGERITVITTRPREDQFLVALADRLARASEERTGLRWESAPRLRIYPTVAAFRDATGEPGWVAASARGLVIRMQPLSVLRSRGSLESTIQHELLHALVESRAQTGLPVWFREGVVLFLTASQKSKVKSQKSKVSPPEDSAFLHGRDEARLAYAAALDCVTELVSRFGEPAVLSWIARGLPPAAMP